ncbi:adenylate kinase [Nanoarchaeota archaeon]
MVKKIFLGAPGSGKGTYSSRISPILKIPHISTGDLLRENVKNKTKIGLKAQDYMNKGLLVSDEIIINMIKERIEQEDCKNGFILDGFPRTIAQAEALKKIIGIDVVIKINVPNEVIIERLSGRITCGKCGKIYHKKFIIPKKEGVCDKCEGKIIEREDDKEEAVKKRLEIYEESTKPLIDFYKNLGILKEIGVISSPDETVSLILRELIKR